MNSDKNITFLVGDLIERVEERNQQQSSLQFVPWPLPRPCVLAAAVAEAKYLERKIGAANGMN